jgi:cell wall-associated NlpC family hydrolase
MKVQNPRVAEITAASPQGLYHWWSPSFFFAALILIFGASCAPMQSPSPDDQTADSGNSLRQRETDVVAAARKNLGIPYRFGGYSPQTGFDCSGLVCWTYEQVGINLPRRARDQIQFGQPVAKKEDLKPGDIVVFKDRRSRTGWHSGIYSGLGRFIHSPSQGKVVEETSLDDQYYARRFAGARRIPRDGSDKAMYVAYQEQLKAEKSASAANPGNDKAQAAKANKNNKSKAKNSKHPNKAGKAALAPAKSRKVAAKSPPPGKSMQAAKTLAATKP